MSKCVCVPIKLYLQNRQLTRFDPQAVVFFIPALFYPEWKGVHSPVQLTHTIYLRPDSKAPVLMPHLASSTAEACQVHSRPPSLSSFFRGQLGNVTWKLTPASFRPLMVTLTSAMTLEMQSYFWLFWWRGICCRVSHLAFITATALSYSIG